MKATKSKPPKKTPEPPVAVVPESNEPMTLTGLTEVRYDLGGGYVKKCEALLAKTNRAIADIKLTTVSEANEFRAEYLKPISEVRIQVGKVRESLQVPVLALQRGINDKAKTFLAPFVAAEAAAQTKLADFAESERKRLEEEQRKLREAQAEAERKQREAEQARLKAEAAAAKAQEDDLPSLSQLKQQLAAEARAAQAQVEVAQSVVAIPQVKMTGAREVDNFEVLNVRELYNFNPDLVKVEVRTQAVKDYIAVRRMQLGNEAEIAIPGLKVTREISVR